MANIAGVAVVVLLLRFAASEDGVLAVDDDHMVAAVHMGGKDGLVLTPEQNGGLGSHAAQGLAGGVNDVPFAVNLTGFRHRGRHSFQTSKSFYVYLHLCQTKGMRPVFLGHL